MNFSVIAWMKFRGRTRYRMRGANAGGYADEEDGAHGAEQTLYTSLLTVKRATCPL